MLNFKTILTFVLSLVIYTASAQKIVIPQFAGCESEKDLEERAACADNNMYKFLNKTLKYPSAAAKKNVKGDVVVLFDVAENGTISNPTVLESLDADCDEEALRIVNAMPKWNPATIDGKKAIMSVQLNIPFGKEMEVIDDTATSATEDTGKKKKKKG